MNNLKLRPIIYPGRFQPPTWSHINIIENFQQSNLDCHLTIVVGDNLKRSSMNPFFTKDRIKMFELIAQDRNWANTSIDFFKGNIPEIWASGIKEKFHPEAVISNNPFVTEPLIGVGIKTIAIERQNINGENVRNAFFTSEWIKFVPECVSNYIINNNLLKDFKQLAILDRYDFLEK